MKDSIFEFLKSEDSYLYNLAIEIEDSIFTDPNGAIIKARKFSEFISKKISEENELNDLNSLTQLERIKALRREDVIDSEIEGDFHNIRQLGNKAAHGEIEDDLVAAISIHKNIYKISCWYMINYISFSFVSGAYKTPRPIVDKDTVNNSDLKALIGAVKDLIEQSQKVSSEIVYINENSEMSEENCVEKEVAISTMTNIEGMNSLINEGYETKEDNEKMTIVKTENNIPTNSKIKNESVYIEYCKEEIKKYLNIHRWTFNPTNGCITIYNNEFKNLLANKDKALASKLKFQIWMKRPSKESASLQVEFAGGGIEYKDLRLSLSNAVKRRLPKDDEIVISKETAAVVMTLKIKAKGIIDNRDDTPENLIENKEAIEAGVKKFIAVFNDIFVEEWIKNEGAEIVQGLY